MAFDQRRKTSPIAKLPSIGYGVPPWLQTFLTAVKQRLDSTPRSLNTFVAIGPHEIASSWTINHGLNNQNVIVQVRLGSNGSFTYPDIAITDLNTVTITSTGSIIPDSYVAVILG